MEDSISSLKIKREKMAGLKFIEEADQEEVQLLFPEMINQYQFTAESIQIKNKCTECKNNLQLIKLLSRLYFLLCNIGLLAKS